MRRPQILQYWRQTLVTPSVNEHRAVDHVKWWPLTAGELVGSLPRTSLTLFRAAVNSTWFDLTPEPARFAPPLRQQIVAPPQRRRPRRRRARPGPGSRWLR